MLWCWLCLKTVEREQLIPHKIPGKHGEWICAEQLMWLLSPQVKMITKKILHAYKEPDQGPF